jgi:hypothetical protein
MGEAKSWEQDNGGSRIMGGAGSWEQNHERSRIIGTGSWEDQDHLKENLIAFSFLQYPLKVIFQHWILHRYS